MWVILLNLLAVMVLTPKSAIASGRWTQTTLTNLYLSGVATTPWGIVAGENDTRLWNDPHNGLYISKDFGNNWQELGLRGRGITDIKYFKGKIYATTYYLVNGENGLFFSEDIGNTWTHKGNNFSAASLYVGENSILVGGFSHGLWASFDNGENWEQKIGEGTFGPHIYAIEGADKIILAALETETWISIDHGNSWTKIEQLNGLRVRNIEFLSADIILIGTDNEDGLYRSNNGGINWQRIDWWGSTAVGGMEFFKDTVYAGRKNLTSGIYDVYESHDLGETWTPTALPQIYNNGITKDLTWVFSNPSYIFAVIPFEGIYKYEIPKDQNTQTPFLNIPWETSNNSELIEKITSYFDHAYPFLGYPYKTEPVEEKDTTLNYLGEKEAQPKFYYSSHDGYDFALPYDTWITAAAPGYATYGYDPDGLGHYITINHANGYETTYAHLQETGLITKDGTTIVSEGQRIGKIGMSGNTTGPHLHFATKLLSKADPENRTDPFGWQSNIKTDPWNGFYWIDGLGEHTGSKSEYLWTLDPRSKLLESKELIIARNSIEHNYTVFIEPYSYPKIPLEQNKLVYVTGTSMLINLYNILGEEIPPLFSPATIEVDISNSDPNDFLANSIKIYHLNEEMGLWEPIESVTDYVNMKTRGYAKEFSRFAVFGIDKNAWKDEAKIFSIRISTNL